MIDRSNVRQLLVNDSAARLVVPEPAGLLAMSALPEKPPLKTWYSGFPEWKHKIALAPETLAVTTGHPGHGKSTLLGNVIFNTASVHNLGVCVATFENHPVPSYRKKLRQFWSGMPEERMDASQKRQADEFINDHYRFLIHPQERPNLNWLIEWADKSNADIFLIDPWNRVESQRGKDETETEYTAWCLTELRLFAKRTNCHVHVIAHPAKRDPKFRGRVPYLEDISGSKHWDNMPDQGFVVHREEFWDADTNARRYDAHFYHLKAREEELGYPCRMSMRLNPETCRFEVVPEASRRRQEG